MDAVLDYVKVFSGKIPLEVCSKATEELKTKTFEPHTFTTYSNLAGVNFSGDKELEAYFGGVSVEDALKSAVWECIRDYVLFVNEPKVFGEWAGFSPLKYNKYAPGTLMAEHVDHIHSIFDGVRRGIPILTCIGVLNNEFSGGQFVMRGDTVVLLSPGDVLVFPSNFMFKHKVEEVVSGERYSFATWVY